MGQIICACLSYTHYWYEVGMLKVPGVMILYLINNELYLDSSCMIYKINENYSVVVAFQNMPLV